MKKLSLVTLLFLTSCKFSFDSSPTPPSTVPPPAPNPLAGCWDPSVKQQESELAQEIASMAFDKSLPDSMADSDASGVKASFTISLSHFETFTYNKDNGSLVCGATYSYTYTRPDGSVFTHEQGNLLGYEVYQGEDGLDASMSDNDIEQISGLQYQLTGDGSN